MEGELEILREVPESLQRLVRFVVRGFYGIEHGLTMDILVRNACVKEDDIIELLKLDKKQLRVVLNQLKNDKFLKSRLFVETQEDGKALKQNFYYVNYRSVANVIKYKLHHMHKRIETMERNSTNRPSFKCPTCESTYSDLQVNQLIDPMFGTLNCTFCQTEVLEDKDAVNNQDGRTLQARFNEQMEPVYKLLKEVENINLSEEVLEPKPTVIPHLHPNIPRINKSHKPKSEEHWSSGRPGFNIEYHQDVIIDLGNEKKEENKVKEVPRWMTDSTVSDMTSSAPSTSDNKRAVEETDSQPLNDEVMQTLIVQERSSKPPAAPSYGGDNNDEQSDEFEDVEEYQEETVYVAGKPYLYDDITQELVNAMTRKEKEVYIQIGQKLYEDMHD